MQPRAATAACRCAWNCLPTGWATNPSPYMFFFTSDDVELAGASPETLTRLEGGVLKTFPLAGTRPRGATAAEDAALEAGLLADQKELAEHNMLVDLGRNDLRRICKLGSVHVDEYLSIHRFSHVMHIGSEVSRPLRRNAAHVRRVPGAPGHLRGVRRHGRLRQAADARQGFLGEGRTR